jgi:CopG family nickel-responsive transcriptional regulator
MSNLIRFGISIEKKLSENFDSYVTKKGYGNRSEAIRDLIRNSLVEDEWEKGKTVAGAISLIYDHHKRELLNKLMDIQHDYHSLVISSQHVHLDHDNCLEILVVKGKTELIKVLFETLRSVKGVKHVELTKSTLSKVL